MADPTCAKIGSLVYTIQKQSLPPCLKTHTYENSLPQACLRLYGRPQRNFWIRFWDASYTPKLTFECMYVRLSSTCTFHVVHSNILSRLLWMDLQKSKIYFKKNIYRLTKYDIRRMIGKKAGHSHVTKYLLLFCLKSKSHIQF